MIRVLGIQLIRLLLVTLCACAAALARAEPVVVYNQLGFLPNSPKQVYVLALEKSKRISWQASSGKDVLKGVSSEFRFDELAQRWVSVIDLTSLNREGNVSLSVGQQKFDIVVSASVYDSLLQQLLRSYYLQRCGVRLEDRLTRLAHAICHSEDGKVSVANTVDDEGQRYEAAGGWHDAGDYGKYVSTTAITASQLLHLYQRFPKKFASISHYIPESRNRVPDVLDEVRVGLDWLLSMQRQDGAFYRKLSGKAWPSLVPPEEDVQARFLFGVATDDSAKAVAALARGARVFEEFDRSQARRYLEAAELGWTYLLAQDEFRIDLHADDDKGSGPYRLNKIDQDSGLTHHQDDYLAAVTQLYLTTQKPNYGREALRLIGKAQIALFEWKNPSLLSIVDLLHSGLLDSSSTLRQLVAQRLLDRASEGYERHTNSELGLANHRIVWGSNKMAAAEGSLLLYAEELLHRDTYLDAAQAQLDYLLGANPHNQTFVSGVGRTPVANVSHIFARATKQDIPGLFVGGPNEAAQAGKAPKNAGLMSYIDVGASYATNEYAIDYNAALIALVTQLTERLSEPRSEMNTVEAAAR